ncbi:MAG TPA: efflux RND transporter periplasmic adaptor subunit [Gemmatimonadales bacterium]|nr:efflux RND transporter periplasmic adaptor subunit [Gemmatimonadales bacterium]
MTRYTGLMMGAAVMLAACGGVEGAPGEGAAAAPAIVLGPRDVAVAARVDLVAGLPVSGTLAPAIDVRLTAPVSEVIAEVLVREGQRVRRGQVLARFRTDIVRPAALSADARQRVAAADYERMQNLLKEGAVSERDVEVALAELRAAEAVAAAAQQRLSEAVVRAPVTGVVTERHVQGGDRVKDGDPLFQLVNIDELEFQASVPSEFAARVRPGAAVALVLSGYPGGVSGRVARVNATADPATRQLQVYVTVANRGGQLVGGLFASGRIVLREVRGALALPQTGIRTDADGGTYVLVIEGGKLARRDVAVGITDEVAGLVEIAQGVTEGAQVVVGVAEGLEPGQAVDVAGREG